MQSLSLKIILDEGAVTRVIKFPARATCADACRLVQEKVLTGEDGKDFGLFLPSADDDLSGIWLEGERQLSHYLLRDGDSLHYRSKVRTLRLRTLDGAVKTMQVDESQPVQALMMTICARLGITNYEEYGLCREDEPEEVAKPATGTLTLRRKPKTREKDLAMDQLSKKLKTDDNVAWLEQHKTLRESGVPAPATLLLQRRLFYSDRRVDARDPVQLGLLYAQARGAVLAGRHPVPEATAVEFAGIQCQVQFGDHQEEKHKPGFIEDLREFLPANYVNSRGIEKKIMKEHKKHVGTSEIDAKFLYTKTVRSLPTYGVTFFLVKEILQGKKKLVPRLLGISAHSVLRMDETTKEVLNEWPLTQVKTYKAGKGELFTLNFGDYSDKEYCVKTNDAHRIRDILQAYIDLIRKKMAAPFNASADDGGAIYSATVESYKGNVMEVVNHSASKAVETSFVGPSRIVSYEHGSPAQAQGAQIMTAQQVIVMSQQQNHHAALAGGVAARDAGDPSADTVRRLNDLNGRAVRIVQLLTDPNQDSIAEAKKKIEEIEEGMPELVEGVKQCVDKQPDEPARQKLSLELNELQENVAQLARFKSPASAQEAAMRLATLSTQLYFALDPRTRRRGELLRMSRNSFIEDERTQAKLQRASLVNTVAVAGEAIEAAKNILDKECEGGVVRRQGAAPAQGRLAGLDAAVALFIAAHADPKNVDYAAAVNAMNTIKELAPELAEDVQALSSTYDETDRQSCLQGMRELCDAVELVCRHTGCDDLEKLHGAVHDYANKSKRLRFIFTRGELPEKGDEVQILTLAKKADEKARLLLSEAETLEGGDGSAAEPLRAAAGALRLIAQLSSDCPRSARSRGALARAGGALRAAARALPAQVPARPGALQDQRLDDLLQALASLDDACGDLDDTDAGAAQRERRRLQFVNTLQKTQQALDDCDAALEDKPTAPSGWLGDTLPLRLAALNAAIASLLFATRDSENPDYAAAAAAVATVGRLLPGVVNDVSWYSGRVPAERRAELLADARALAAAARALASGASEGQDPHDAVADFARASGRLIYVFDRRADPDRENEIIDLTKSACAQSSELLSSVHGLAGACGAQLAGALDAAGAAIADAARDLLAAASLTAPTTHLHLSQSALASCVARLSAALGALAGAWAGAAPDRAGQLAAQRQLVDDELQKLLDALNDLPDDHAELKEDPIKQKKRVRFVFSLSQIEDAAGRAEMEIDKPLSSQPVSAAQAPAARRSLADKLAALNAAIAALAVATQDRSDPDVEAVEEASAAIQQLLPQVVQETKALPGGSGAGERGERRDALRALCAAAADVCAGAARRDHWAPSDAVARYARAAARLSLACDPRVQPVEQQVLAKSESVCEQSQAILAAAHQLRAAGSEEAARGAARAARALQHTAQLTSSSLHAPPCRAALLRAASALSAAMARLHEACRLPGQASPLAGHREAFDKAVEELMLAIKQLEDDTQEAGANSPELEKRRMKFVTTRDGTQRILDNAVRDLDEVGKSAPLAPSQADAMQLSFSDRLATLSAAVAALLAATRDAEEPEYEAAESASATIQELMPDLVKDAKTLSSSKDEAARDSLQASLRALCEATRALNSGDSAGKDQELHDAVRKFTNASGKLVYTFNPRADSAKGDQIIELTKSACRAASELAAGGRRAEPGAAARVADAAHSLLATAELTAPRLPAPPCRGALLAALAALRAAAGRLAAAAPETRAARAPLDAALATLEDAIGPAKRKPPPAVPARGAPGGGPRAATSRFLDALRREASAEGYDQTKSEEEQAKSKFEKSVESARKNICAAEDDLLKHLKSENKPLTCLDDAQICALSKQMEQNIARANAAAAHLLACRCREKSDYTEASKCITAFSDLFPAIVKDAITLGGLKEAKGTESSLSDSLGLCAAAVNLCDAAKADMKELTEVALSFGDQSSKLLYAISTDIDPSQQNEVLARARAVGAAAGDVTRRARDARAARCAASATVLMYIAKLVAPSIQDPECQAVLISASKDLARQLKSVPATRPEVASELADLQKLLEALQSDVAGGRLVKKREKLVIEDTPLKRLTEQIIEHAKQNAESTERGAEERREMAAFANQLTAALKELDVANARCLNAPRDMKRRGELEGAVYEAQRLVLQARPGAAPGAVVDLAEYLSAVSDSAGRLARAAGAAGAVAAHARETRAAAERARAPRGDLERAVQECVSRAQKINAAIESCAEGPEKKALKIEARSLAESCALLEFAAQSAGATAQCAELDEAISDLLELGGRLGGPRSAEPATRTAPAQTGACAAAGAAAGARLAAAAARAPRRARQLAPALARYAAALRARAPPAHERCAARLVDHLARVHDGLMLLTMESCRLVQTWRRQPGAAAPVLQELDNMEAVIGIEPGETGRVAQEDLRRLLLPVRTYAVEGDSKQLEAKLESSATKLNSMTETIALSVGNPESLARCAHVTSESAVQLAAIARALKNDEDPTKVNNIEEAAQELCFVTYDLLKTAESASREPNSFDSRRRLLDACRALTEAINDLVRNASSGDCLRRDCTALARSLPRALAPRPACALPYDQCVAAVHTQHDAILNLPSEKPMSREEFGAALQALSSAVFAAAEHAEHCAYLLAIAEQHPQPAKGGLFDAARVQKLVGSAQDTCFRATRSGIEHQAKEESSLLSKQLCELKQAVEESIATVEEAEPRQQLLEARGSVEAAGAALLALMAAEDVSADKLTPSAFAAVAALSTLSDATRSDALAPPPPANTLADEVIDQAKELVARAAALLRVVETTDSRETMTWVMFGSYTKAVGDSSEQLLACLRTRGHNAGILEATALETEEETDATFKSYVQTQVAIAKKWLNKPTFKSQMKTDGEAAARNVIDIGNKMASHLKDAEAEEMRHLAEECEQLLARCLDLHDLDTASTLADRLKDLARAVDRCIVGLVVELADEEPLADLEALVDAETDEAKRKLVLEQKIKELVAHLARVTRTARALRGRGARELARCGEQASLLAPMLVKAAEKRVMFPTDKAVVEEYRTQLAQYSEALSRVRDLCDRAVDPMQFVQAAEEKMQRMKEESTSHQNDLQKYSHTSTAIRKLANRVIHVSMSSASARRDAELMRALAHAQRRLQEVAPRNLRASKLPDWDDSIAEVLRATGEVEAALGGELIFNKPPEPGQPIYNAARNLHAAVREWSARDNDIVSEAKRMAVLMAKLSEHVLADKKREVISTSKAIVAASREVARLARQLALECADMRLRTNLLQLCDQILTIGAQLKMLSNVKKSSFGHQGNEEDIEAMNMLVGNAQNLMLTIQDTVGASFGASVKIRSQRGGARMRWVRKNYRPAAPAQAF